MSMLSVCERDRGSTYILYVSRIFERYLLFGKSENAWDDRTSPWNLSLLQLGKIVYKLKIYELVAS